MSKPVFLEYLNGFITAPFPPIKKNGSLNIPVINKYTRLYDRNGMKGVFICGSYGEGSQLAVRECRQTAEKWISVYTGDIKTPDHVGGFPKEENKQLAILAAEQDTWEIARVLSLVLPGKPDAKNPG